MMTLKRQISSSVMLFPESAKKIKKVQAQRYFLFFYFLKSEILISQFNPFGAKSL